MFKGRKTVLFTVTITVAMLAITGILALRFPQGTSGAGLSPVVADGGPVPITGSHKDKWEELKRQLKEKINEDRPASAPLVPWQDAQQEKAGGTAPGFSTQMPNPYGCYGQTDDPHKSNTYGTANVHGRTVCGVAVPEIRVATQLFKWVCYPWPNCWYQEHGPMDETIGYDRWSVQATSAGACENGTYKGASAHYVLGADGKEYVAFTANVKDITNC